MSLLAEATAYRPSRARCTMVGVYAALSDKDAAELREALGDPAVPGRGIHLALSTRGIVVGYDTVRRHRNRSCSCGEL